MKHVEVNINFSPATTNDETISAPWVAPGGTEVQTPEVDHPNKRKHHALRTRIDQLIGAGFDVTGRNPLRIARGAQAYIAESGFLKAG